MDLQTGVHFRNSSVGLACKPETNLGRQGVAISLDSSAGLCIGCVALAVCLPFLPKHPSVYVSPVTCPIEIALILGGAERHMSHRRQVF